MWLAYPFVVFGGIIATVLSAPIINDGGGTARTEQESTSVAARVLIPVRIAPEAPRSLCDRSLPPPLGKHGNKKRQDCFSYSSYSDNPEKSKRQDDFGYSVIAKRQDSFGYSDYDDNPEISKRQDDFGYSVIVKRQDSFGYSDYDDNPEISKRQDGFGYSANAKRQDSFGYSDYDSNKAKRERRQFGYSSYATPRQVSEGEE